jgi:hypothetical protein
MATKLAPEEISDLDPYKFMAVIGKRIHASAGVSRVRALAVLVMTVIQRHPARRRGTSTVMMESFTECLQRLCT